MARSSSWSIGRVFQSKEPEPPSFEQRVTERIAAMQEGFRRRVSDTIEIAFHQACLTGDMETAESLVAILERMNARAPELSVGGGTRRQPIATARLREEMEEARLGHEESRQRQMQKALELG